MAGLDLKNPGGKEILIFGGAAAGLALIYFALSKKTSTAQPPAQQSAAATGTGTGSFGGTPVSGSPTGNVFQDIAPTPTTAATGGGLSGGPTGPPVQVKPAPHSTVQGAGAILGSPGVTATGPPISGVSGGVASTAATVTTVYNALRHAGLNAAQAAGVLGNIQNESTFRIDVSALDTNGAYSYGLVQWNAASHPNARQFVTGNLAHDLQTQVAAIVQAVKGLGLPANATAGQVAGAFASRFEGCQGCQPGGTQYSQRVANAAIFYQNIIAGRYNPPKPKPNPAAGVKAATPGQIQSQFPIVAPTAPVASRTRVRAVAAKPRPLGGSKSGWQAAIRTVTNPFPRLTAAVRPRPAPRRAAPVVRKAHQGAY